MNLTIRFFLFSICLFGTSSPSWASLKVLTYSSLLDKGGLGEELKKRAPNVEFTTSKDFAGILGTLRRLKREARLSEIDVVMGLNEAHYQSALQEGLVQKGEAFEESSFSILVNKEKLPESAWPRTWEELPKKLDKKLLVQDPRTSEIGLTWLLNAAQLKNLDLEAAKKLPKKIFPNWSSSFEAFESGIAPAIWTYSTSVAYFHCTGDKRANRFVNLPLPSYPKDKNYVALGPKPSADSTAFQALVLSNEIQQLIWEKNWMFPARSTKMPECYTKLWFPKDAKILGALDPKELLKRLDQWSL